MSLRIEDYLPPIQSAGLVTDENTTLGGTLAVTGASTFTGAETFNGAASFTSTVSFATNPTFTGGRLVPVVSATTGATLTIAQSGSVVVFNSTTGVPLVLPAPQVGAYYDFVIGQTVAAGTHGIRTSSGVFLGGSLLLSPTAGTVATVTGNGTSHVVVSMNGSTTGGVAGGNFRAVCTSATVWTLSGNLLGTGSLATPIA
jgi:hypothetical protein